MERTFALLVLISGVLLVGCDSIIAPIEISERVANAAPPHLEGNCLFRPTFNCNSGQIQAGTAFVVEIGDRRSPVLVSALHLLGPDGGLPKKIKPANIDRELQSIELFGLFDDELVAAVSPRTLEMRESAPLGEASKYGDVMAFELDRDVQVGKLKLANSMPEVNEPVWMAGQILDGAPMTKKLHVGQFLGIDYEGDFVVQFANRQLELQATSGAPILNAAGEVVAINLGGWSEDGYKFGVGNPVSRFRGGLLNALGK